MAQEMGYQMRASRVLKTLREGGTVFSIKLNLADSRVAEIAALAGFDCIWTCMEHVGNDWSVIERQILAAKAYDVDTIVRVSRGSYSDYIRPLEMDASGIMIPHVMNVQDAKHLIRHTKFHPVGMRPMDGGNADGSYGIIPSDRYVREANEQRLIIMQIEDPESLDQVEEIARLPGVDMLFFGPGDFSQSIGMPGHLDHPQVEAARRRVAESAIRAGKFAGTIGQHTNYRELEQMGYRFINLGADVNALTQYFRHIMGQISGVSHEQSRPYGAAAKR